MSTLATDLRRRMRHPLPGFGLSLGLGMSWLALIVLLPLAALVVRAAGLGTEGWLRVSGWESVSRASFSQAISTSPMPRSTKVVVAPRAPVSSTGTFLNSFLMNSFAVASLPPGCLRAQAQAAR